MRNSLRIFPLLIAALSLSGPGGIASAKDDPAFGPAVDAFCDGMPGFEVLPVLGEPYTVGTEWPPPGQSCGGCHVGYPGLPQGPPFYGCDQAVYGSKCARLPQFDWYQQGNFAAFCPPAPAVNNPPVLDPIGSWTLNENEPLTFTVSASDPDGNALSFELANAPTGATLNDHGDGTADFSWTPTYAQAGNYEVTVIVTDDGDPIETSSQTFAITVGNVNRAPALDPIGDRSVDEGAELAFTIHATDPDGNNLWFDGANLPTGAALTDNGDGSASFSWTPSYTQAGSFDATFLVTDDGAPMESDSEQIRISVGNVNRAPTLDPVGNRSASEGVPLTIALGASDPDGDVLSFEASNMPTGAELVDHGNGSAEFAWTPDFGQTGDYPVSFIVTDDGVPMQSDSEQITIAVGDVNRAPTLDPVGNRTVPEGTPLAIMLTASDPDGDVLHFEAAGLPPGATLLDHGIGSGDITWTPTFEQAGNYAVTVIVSDEGSPIQSDSEQITITVGDVNRPPVLDSIGNRTATEGEPLTIALTGSDPDGDGLSFGATGLPSGAQLVDLGGSAELSWTPMSGQAGNYPLTLSVADDGTPVESDSEEITISVASVDLPPANRPPVLDPVGDRTVTEGEPLTITLTASDPDGDGLSFGMDPLPAEAVLLDEGTGSARFSWTPGPESVGDHTMMCSVTDDGSPAESDSEMIVVHVEPAVTDPPTEPPPAPDPGTGHLELQRARWTEANARLEVRGRTDAFAMVEIRMAGSAEVIGEVAADDEGKFVLNTRPYVVPCAVEARVSEAYAGPLAVENAPAECGQTGSVYLRIREIEWSCTTSELHVFGDHAPVSATVAVYDADTGEPIGSSEAQGNGRFDYRMALEMAPSRVQVGVVVAGEAWLGAPLPVVLGDGCGSQAPPETEDPPGWSKGKATGRPH